MRFANLHAAHLAASADLTVQQGEEILEGSGDEDAVLEVIVYEVVE